MHRLRSSRHRIPVRQHLLHQHQVDVVATEMRVAVGGQHLEDAVLDPENRDVERAAAEVVDRDEPGVPLVEAVGERRRGRLVDDAEHVEAGDPAGVARGGPLRVVEVRRDRDDGAIDVRIDLALLGEVLLGAVLQLAQDERRDLRRRELARPPSPILHDTARTSPGDRRNGNSRDSSPTSSTPLPMKRFTE